MAAKLAPILSGLLLGACSVVGIRSGTEQPRYDVVGRAGPVEIRRYGPLIVAETTVTADEEGARSGGFRRLASYIFGGNAAQASIAMTAPVTQDKAAEGWTIQFVMPATATLGSLPAPTDPAVRLSALPAQTLAVLRYTGSIAPAAVAARQAELLQHLHGSAWRPEGQPVAWFYDPPWTLPFLRRNEVAVPVE